MNLTGVFSDLKVMTGSDLPSSNALRNMFESSAPPGYDGFRPYIPGYYDFQKAIFRHVIQARTGTPVLSGLEFTVDMPDVVDRGQASVAAGQLKQVYFSKRFTIPPEIGHTVIAANEYCTVRITQLDETGFIFHMVNAANTRIGGTISWSATGY